MRNQHPTQTKPAVEEVSKESTSTATALDLEAYFQRIGYTGECMATISTLKNIHLLHPQAIAFENLNPLLRLPVKLDLASIQQKLVKSGRGGYCFEHNLLLSEVLKALGFQVKGLAARVLWNVPEGVTIARGHMLLRVEAEGKSWIADAGFGGLTLTAPLLLETDIEQETPHEPFRIIGSGEEYILQVKLKEAWKSIYRFGLQEYLLPDYEVVSWYLSNHPDSHFVTGLIAARVDPDRRYALRNNELVIHHLHQGTEKQILSSTEELQSVLKGIFHIRLPETSNLEEKLQGCIQSV